MQIPEIKLDVSGKVILPGDLIGAVQLVPHAEIKTIINGNRVYRQTTVDQNDHIEVEAVIKEINGEIILDISKDTLFAYLQLIPTKKIFPKINIKNSLQGFLLEIYPQTQFEYRFNLTMILELLEQKGITFGIDQQAIEMLLQNPSDKRVMIAKGVKPTLGVDESITVLFDTKKDDRPKILADGTVDFKQKRIALANIGEVLAVKVPGQPGQPGMGVDGHPIAPPAYKKLELIAGQGTSLQQDGFSVVAMENGLPSIAITRNVWTFQVIPLLEYNEVNISTGNVEFNGDLRINNDVAEGMSVFSSANIDIGGSVFGARVTALGNLNIRKNAISSFIVAGGRLEFQEELKAKLQHINKALSELYQLLLALRQRCKELDKGFSCGPMITCLINKKFVDVPKIVDDLYAKSKDDAIVSANIRDLISELVVKFRRLGWDKTREIEEVQRIQQRVATSIAYLDELKDSRGDVIVGYAINSTIESSGDVRVVGKGCINTIINARGNVIIESIFRGGTINCRGTIKIKEAGSETGTKTHIKTSGDAIRIDKAYPNVVVSSGMNSRALNNIEYKLYVIDD
jgi:hypothetical protein